MPRTIEDDIRAGLTVVANVSRSIVDAMRRVYANVVVVAITAPPQVLFDHYDRIYHVTCDVAASQRLAKCKHYYDREKNGLLQTWKGVCWMNPP